jgi:hypothetical protein
MSARRRKVTYFQVMWPLLILFAAIVIILTTWTIVDPWQWTREIVADVLPIESFGRCESEHFNAYFWPCAALIGVPTLLTIIAVWRTKDISQDLSDTSMTFYLVVTQFQAWLLGVPILVVLGTSSVDASYLGRVLLVWLFAVAPLLIVIGPTIFRTVAHRKNPNARQTRRRTSATGTVHVSGFTASSKHHASGTFSSDVGNSSSSQSRTTQAAVTMAPISESSKPLTGSSIEDLGTDAGDTSGHFDSNVEEEFSA